MGRGRLPHTRRRSEKKVNQANKSLWEICENMEKGTGMGVMILFIWLFKKKGWLQKAGNLGLTKG